MRLLREATGGGGWWLLFALFVLGLARRLSLPMPLTPPAGYMTVGVGVLTVSLIRNWKLRVAYASTAWLTSLAAIGVAPCALPYTQMSSCKRLYSVHVLLSLSIALGLLMALALALALDSRPSAADQGRACAGTGGSR